MILHRLADSLRKQNWITVMLEVVIVVVGIFIGLQVDDWNSARKDRVEETLILDRLKTDFENLATTGEILLGTSGEVIAFLDVVLDVIDAGVLADNQKAGFLSGLARGYSNNSPIGRSGTFTEVTSDGGLRLLRDENLRVALQAYDLDVIAAPNAWLEIRSVQNLYIKDFTRHFTYARQGDFSESHVGTFDLEAILKDPDFKNAAIEIRRTQLYFYYWHKRLLDNAKEVQKRLEG
jgi:Family of unknown function (DUF6090)